MAEAAGARTRCVWVFWSRARLAPQQLAVFSLTVLDTRQLPVILQVFSCDIFFGYLPRRELGAVYDPELERELAAEPQPHQTIEGSRVLPSAARSDPEERRSPPDSRAPFNLSNEPLIAIVSFALMLICHANVPIGGRRVENASAL